MAATVNILVGGAQWGKTTRLLGLYRDELKSRGWGKVLWLAPNLRAVQVLRERLIDAGLAACLAPGVITFEKLAGSLLQFSAGGFRPLPRDMQWELIRLAVQQLAENGQLQYFASIAQTAGLIDEVYHAINRLKRAGIEPEKLLRAAESARLGPRGRDLATIYGRYEQMRQKHGWCDQEGRFWAACELLAFGPKPPFEAIEVLIVDGFAHFTPAQYRILQIWSEWLDELWISLTFEESGREDLFVKPRHTLQELRRLFPCVKIHQQQLLPSEDRLPPVLRYLERGVFSWQQTGEKPTDASCVKIVVATTQLNELEQIAGKIKRLLVDGDLREGTGPVPPDQIVVVFRSLFGISGLVREVFTRFGIPFWLESGRPLWDVPLIRFFLKLVALGCEEWSVDRLIGVLGNNYFRPPWPERNLSGWLFCVGTALREVGVESPRKVLELSQQRASSVAVVEILTGGENPKEGGLPGFLQAGRSATSPTSGRGTARLNPEVRAAGNISNNSTDNPAKAAAFYAEDDGFAETYERRFQLAEQAVRQLREWFQDWAEPSTLERWIARWERLAQATGLLEASEVVPGWQGCAFGGRRDGSPGEFARKSPPCPSPPRQLFACVDDTLEGNVLADRQAWAKLLSVLRKLADLVAEIDPSHPKLLSAKEALELLREMVRRHALPPPVDDSGRVRILSATTARSIQVPYLFVAGLTEGSFPARQAGGIWDLAESEKLAAQGLNLPRERERPEEEMFLCYEVLSRATGQVVLSYAAVDDQGEAVLKSPFLEEVELALGPGGFSREELPDLVPVPRHEEPFTLPQWRVKALADALAGNIGPLKRLLEQAELWLLGESLRASLHLYRWRQRFGVFTPFDGLLASRAARRKLAQELGKNHIFSPTSLENYVACPFRFLLMEIERIEPVAEEGLGTDFLLRGKRFHQSIRKFHERLIERFGRYVSFKALDGLSADELARIWEESFPELDASVRNPVARAYYEVDRQIWSRLRERYLEHWQAYDRECEKRYGTVFCPARFEVAFGKEWGADYARSRAPEADSASSATFELRISRKESVQFAGQIDRIDVAEQKGQAYFNIIDYKSGMVRLGGTLGWEDLVRQGAALQLPLYVLAAQKLNLVGNEGIPVAAGYWELSGGGFKTKRILECCASERRRDDEAGAIGSPTPTWKDIAGEVLPETVGKLVGAMRRGDFPVAPRDEDCTRNCPFREVCRIAEVRSLKKGRDWKT